MNSDSTSSLPADASTLLPHAHPMLLVDRIMTVNDDEKSSIVEAIIKPDCPFLSSDNLLNPEALAEVMAQAAAAQHGYNLARNNENEEEGFIVGIRKFCIKGTVKVKDILEVSVKLGPEIESLSVVYSTVRCKKREVASAELTVWHGRSNPIIS